MDSDDEAELNKTDVPSIERRAKMQDWFKFCESKVSAIEKIWNRKLENPNNQADKSEETKSEDQELEWLGKFNFEEKLRKNSAKSQGPALRKQDSLVGYLEQARQAQSKDDVFNKEHKTDEFGDNQFWK